MSAAQVALGVGTDRWGAHTGAGCTPLTAAMRVVALASPHWLDPPPLPCFPFFPFPLKPAGST